MEETNMAGDVWRRVLAGPVATSGVDALQIGRAHV